MEKIDVAILVKRLNEASDAYYNGSEPLMSDIEFDELMEHLKQIESKTGIVLANSPTHRVGAVATGDKIKHNKNHPMLSLDKCHTVQELINFAGNDDCYLSVKCDGLSTRLCYKCTNGKTAHLVSAATRGDGVEGSNIFEHMHYYDNVPLIIPYDGDFVIDGESVILQDDFDKIVETEPQYKNPRNLASGTLANQDMNVVKQRHMKFVAWRVIEGWNDIDNNFAKLNEAKNLGFTVVPLWTFPSESMWITDRETGLNNRLHLIRKEANEQGIPMDGAVLAKCSNKLSNSMGRTEKFFRHSIAYKYDDDEYETRLLGIDWTVGKTATITPTAIFREIDIDGSTVKRASLCNLSIMKDLNLTNGCTVFVKKCNCIIPKITRCLDDGNGEISIIKKCPICGGVTRIVKENDSEVLMCTNPSCGGKLLGQLAHAVSKKALNIDGLSESTLSFLINEGWVSNIKDLYNLKNRLNEWSKSDGFGKTSVNKILEAIEKSRNIDLAHFICALSIPTIGSTASKIISDYCDDDFNQFVNATLYTDWTTLPTFGETMAKHITNWIENYGEDMCVLADEMRFIKEEKKVITDNPMFGKKFCITGSFSQGRTDLQKRLEALGATFVSSVSKNLDVLFVGEKAGSKLTKAQSLEIRIADEEELMKILGE